MVTDGNGYAYVTFDPGDIIQTLNRENPLTDDGEYFTIWVGCLHLPTRQLRYATAGHPGALLTRKGQPGRAADPRAPRRARDRRLPGRPREEGESQLNGQNTIGNSKPLLLCTVKIVTAP